MPRTKSSNEYERKLLENIKEYGWQCTSVGAGEDSVCFSYTIGLYHSFGYPELIILGQPHKTAHGVLTVAGAAAAEGKPIAIDRPTDALLKGYPAVFVQVPVTEYGNYVLSAKWYYEGNAFPLYQVVWPFRDGRFPWDPSVPQDLRDLQPVLGSYAVGA